jgi:hypothetical protein
MARITGHLGAVYIPGTGTPAKVIDTFDWTLETTVKAERTSVKGNTWERMQTGRAGGTITISAYITTKAFLTKDIINAVNSGSLLTFRLDAIDGNATFQQISGTAYMTRGTIGMPHDDLATDVVELTLDGPPTFT